MKGLHVTDKSLRHISKPRSIHFKSTTIVAAEGYEMFTSSYLRLGPTLPLWLQFSKW